MKLSSISLVGAALAAVVVSAIAASVPRSLEQVNLSEHDVDGELVDGLFTRVVTWEERKAALQAAHQADLQAARQVARQQAAARLQAACIQAADHKITWTAVRKVGQNLDAGDAHIALADAHMTAAMEHHEASVTHTKAGIKTRNLWHDQKAWQHSREAVYHFKQREQNLLAAPAAYAGTRTDKQKSLIKYPSAPTLKTGHCANDATLSKKYASDVIDHHDSNGLKPHPSFREPRSRHQDAPIRYGDPVQ